MKINGKTKLCALIGNPVEHSMSPVMHNAAFDKLDLNYRYLCLRVENHKLESAIKGMRALNIAGFNVTVPHKQAVIPFLDEIDPVAEKTGAVNTIVNNKGTLKGYNTDWLGLARSIKEHTEIKNKKVVLLGAGGAARGIAFGINEKKPDLIILNRTVEKAEKLANEVGCNFGGLDKLDNIKADILINSTTAGMHPDTDISIATKEQLKKFKVVFDAVYNPLETKLLRLAKKAGCKTIPGLKMLVYQGVAAFELWTGKKPDAELMYKKAKQKLKEKN